MQSSACVDIYFAGLAYISGWKLGQPDNFVLCVKLPLAKRKSFHCTGEVAESKKTLEIRSLLDHPVRELNLNLWGAFRGLVSEKVDFICHLGLVHFLLGSSHHRSTSVTRDLRQLFEECRSTKKINLYLEYSYGSLLFSCVGSSLRENSKDTVNSDDLVFLFLNLSVLSHFPRILYHMCMYVYIKFVLVIICHSEVGPGYNL
nr:PREDICTED: uncharacterized protein LOC109035459 isoform X1 [Bemisia tabaci]